MKWKISYSKDARKFIENHRIDDDMKNIMRKFLHKMKGEDINIDLKKLIGDWKGYYRIRIGNIRLIFAVSKASREIYVHKVDFRGDVYK